LDEKVRCPVSFVRGPAEAELEETRREEAGKIDDFGTVEFFDNEWWERELVAYDISVPEEPLRGQSLSSDVEGEFWRSFAREKKDEEEDNVSLLWKGKQELLLLFWGSCV